MKNLFTLKKHYIIAVILSLITGNISAQTPELWGMTPSGGQHNAGTIYKTDSNGNAVAQYSFKIEEKRPSSSLLLAPNDKLYGLTSTGGDKNFGILYKYDISTNTFTNLVDFTGQNNGANPDGDLLLASNGKIYGVTSKGGINDLGTIFEFDINSNTLIKIYDFDGNNTGSHPYGGLIQTANGTIYGTTSRGGNNDNGTLFSFNPANHSLIKLYDFQNTTSGQKPMGKLTLANNGLIYGTTREGGTNNFGMIFQFNTTDQTMTSFNVFTSFGWVDSALFYAGNVFYGIATIPSGTDANGDNIPQSDIVFSFNPTSATINNIYNLGGWHTPTSFMQASDNKLYSASFDSLISLDLNTQNVTTLYNFTSENGLAPIKKFIEINNKLYGVTSLGGEKNSGTIYSFDINTNTYQNLYNLKGSILGSNPYGKLLQISNQKFIGLTANGGEFNKGSIFEYNRANNTYSVLYSFDGTNGAEPLGTLLKAADGNYYGATYQGGNGSGVFFEFNPITNTYHKIAEFDSNNGIWPLYSKPVQVANGSIYGTTSYRGANGGGTIYKYVPDTQSFSIVYQFTTQTGKNPMADFILTSNEKLIGLAKKGGANGKGVIFEFDPQTDTYNKLYDFDGNNTGGYPKGRLIEVANGIFYGLTSYGGANNDGALFEYNVNTNTFTKKVDFDLEITGGKTRAGELYKASNNLLYGVLRKGGTNELGTLFNYDYINDIFTKLFDFDNTNGAYPQGGLIEYNPNLSIVKNTFDAQIKVYPNPTKGFFKIAFDNEIKDITAVLLSIDGRIIETKNITKSNAIQFNIKQPNGIYFVHITNNTGKQAVIKVVKK